MGGVCSDIAEQSEIHWIQLFCCLLCLSQSGLTQSLVLVYNPWFLNKQTFCHWSSQKGNVKTICCFSLTSAVGMKLYTPKNAKTPGTIVRFSEHFSIFLKGALGR